MMDRDREAFADLLDEFRILFDRNFGPGFVGQYWERLRGFDLRVVRIAAAELKTTLARFPTVADFHAACRKAGARRRSRRESGERKPEFGPAATWSAEAMKVRVMVRLAAHVPLGDNDAPLARRVLDEANAGLATLRSRYETPGDALADELRQEQQAIVRRIVATLGHEVAA